MFLSRFYIGLFIFYIKLVYCVPQDTSRSNQVRINKCCEPNEIYINRHCTAVNISEQWRPLFTSDKGHTNLQISYR